VLRASWGPFGRITISSLLFALLHFDGTSIQPIYVFALGVCCGWLREKYASLGPSVLLHVWNNTIAVSIRTFVGV
jgi:membrane protease YdiL (CAAX protease family)